MDFCRKLAWPNCFLILLPQISFRVNNKRHHFASFFNCFSTSSMKIRSMASSEVGTIVNTLSNCEIEIKRATESFKPTKINTPDAYLHNLCPTSKLLSPDESANLIWDRSITIFHCPSVLINISSDFNCGVTNEFNLDSLSFSNTYLSCLSTVNFISYELCY